MIVVYGGRLGVVRRNALVENPHLYNDYVGEGGPKQMNLRKAKDEIRAEVARLTKVLAALDAIGGPGARNSRGSIRLSAAARRRISSAQRARWARWRKANKRAA